MGVVGVARRGAGVRGVWRVLVGIPCGTRCPDAGGHAHVGVACSSVTGMRRWFSDQPVTARLRLTVPAGKAAPTPPTGPTLGQAGLNIMAFCKDFNARTADVKEGTPMRVKVRAFKDRSFEFDVLCPPTSQMIMRAAGMTKGGTSPGKEKYGTITVQQVYEMARVKQKDANMKTLPLEAIARSIVGVAKSVGVAVVRPPPVYENAKGGAAGAEEPSSSEGPPQPS